MSVTDIHRIRQKNQEAQGDFSKGPVWKCILHQTGPLIVAQFVLLLYNVVDRIYIGHLPGEGSVALTGIGLVFPIVSLVAAFTYLYGTGGAPLFSIARGKADEERASRIQGNTFTLLVLTSAAMMILCYSLKRPILYLFGASDDTFVYANQYLMIYLLGTPFVMLSTGLNNFINAQGFPKIGMFTTVIGAVINFVLDPILIFVFGMGVRGAAIATVISQVISAIWVLRFLFGEKALLPIRRVYLPLEKGIVAEIVQLGLTGFIMQATNSLVQAVCNSTLRVYGGDTYVGIMTVINSVREIMTLPVMGLTGGAQPVLGFNYGAKEYDRVRTGIKVMAAVGASYTMLAWLAVRLFPTFFLAIFTSDQALIAGGVAALHIYFCGFVFMTFQNTGQATFTALGYAKRAIFFSLLRKAFIVVPLTIVLPMLGLGAHGVFWAEPISNVVGGTACVVTMYFTVYKKIGRS